jgi:hypothetical protein
VLKNVVMENLCACVDFFVFCIHFKGYDHSNCAIAIEDVRNSHFPSVLLAEMIQGLLFCKLNVHGSVHRNINLIERTNKMQPCSRIYYSNVS